MICYFNLKMTDFLVPEMQTNAFPSTLRHRLCNPKVVSTLNDFLKTQLLHPAQAASHALAGHGAGWFVLYNPVHEIDEQWSAGFWEPSHAFKARCRCRSSWQRQKESAPPAHVKASKTRRACARPARCARGFRLNPCAPAMARYPLHVIVELH